MALPDEVEIADAAPPRMPLYARARVIGAGAIWSGAPRRRKARRFETTANGDRPTRNLKRPTDTWPGRP
jgi:hypothetical protein